MGLSIEVGILADLNKNDEEGAENFRQEFATLNRFLASLGLPPHQEPESCAVWSSDMWGYSGLHYLRRAAAHVDLRGCLPLPGHDGASQDPVLQEYFRLATEEVSEGFFARTFKRRPLRTFDHLIVHSDAEGFYLPRDMSCVLVVDEDYPVPGAMIGSSVKLLNECERLASLLELPLELDPQSDELSEAAEAQADDDEPPGNKTWQRYGMESFICVRLHRAAMHSVSTGAAIVFT